MFDKIKGLFKKEDSSIQAPKELPNLLYEEKYGNDASLDPVKTDVISSPKANPINPDVSINAKQQNIDIPKPFEEKKPEPPKEPSYPIAQKATEAKPPQSSQPQFIDESIDEVGENIAYNLSTRSQGEAVLERKPIMNNDSVLIKQKEIDIASLEPKIPIMPQPAQKTMQMQTVQINQEIKTPPAQSGQIKETSEIPSQKTTSINFEDSFFNNLEKAIRNSSDIAMIHELLNQDLFKSMKIHHRKNEDYINRHMKLTDIEQKVNQKIIHLKVLEDEWLMEKKKLELQEAIFIEKEEEVFQGIEDLKLLFSKLDFAKKLNEKIGYDRQFILRDGQRIESFANLITHLKMMDDWVYNHHVTLERNDFADWIRNVYNAKEIADEIAKVKQKKELIEFLENI